MIRAILTVPDARLSARCADAVAGDEAARVLEDLRDTVLDANGLGLAAPQIGELVRAVVIRDPDTERVWGMINPRIVRRSGVTFPHLEGCLSVPGASVRCRRNYKIWVHAQRADGADLRFELQGLAAAAVQHEIDHLNGITIARSVVSAA